VADILQAVFVLGGTFGLPPLAFATMFVVSLQAWRRGQRWGVVVASLLGLVLIAALAVIFEVSRGFSVINFAQRSDALHPDYPSVAGDDPLVVPEGFTRADLGIDLQAGARVPWSFERTGAVHVYGKRDVAPAYPSFDQFAAARGIRMDPDAFLSAYLVAWADLVTRSKSSDEITADHCRGWTLHAEAGLGVHVITYPEHEDYPEWARRVIEVQVLDPAGLWQRLVINRQ